jgi:cytochrome c2
MLTLFKACRKYLGFISAGLTIIAAISLTAYTDKRPASSYPADSLELNPFREPGFPFLPGSLDARKLGAGFPDDNMAARILSIPVGDSAYVAFDTDLLRWSAAWTGKFLPMVLMAQISYKDFFNKNNKVPTLTGDPQIATGSYAGWSTQKPDYTHIRTRSAEEPNWDPMPAEEGRWKGVFAYGKNAILNYTVGKTEIFEMPGGAMFGDQQVFTRSFRFASHDKDLYLTASEVPNATGAEAKGRIAVLYHGVNKDSITALVTIGKGKFALQPGTEQNRFLTVKVPASEKTTETAIAVWKGPVSKKASFEKFARKFRVSFPDFQQGGPAYWNETITTKGKLSPDTAAFVTDQLALPLPNPWKRNVRIADIAFHADGRASAVTFEGDVWTVEGIDKDLQNIKWRRFASGLHEPMSIEIVRDTLYVFGREGIVRLHDLNKDGSADYYENFSNVMAQSAESREWAADMVLGPDGCFYIAKGGSQSNGPGVSKQVAKGFREGSQHNGTVMKISQDGLSYDIIATGLRGPYLGMNPKTGMLTASDQQGNFVPSTPIYLIKKGDYFGVPATEHRKDNPAITPALTWLPHRVDRSSISQAWATSDKMGPLNDNLIHFSFARPGLFRVLIDSSASIAQGGVSYIHANYPAPTSKGTINPVDGQMYITGFNLWGSSSKGISALMRMRYTGKPSYMPNQFRAGEQGIMLSFDSELDAGSVLDVANFQVKRWNYKRTQEYGSGHFKLDGSTGEETLNVVASYLSADKKKVLLLVQDMKEAMQFDVAYQLQFKDGKQLSDHLYFTLNNPSALDPASFGFSSVDLALLKAKQPEPAAETEKETIASAEKGKELFQKMACFGCHSEGTQTKGMYGPPFQDLYKSVRHFEDGTSAVADERYIRESILSPGVKIVKGYNEEMPSFVGILNDNEIESITLYIKELKK